MGTVVSMGLISQTNNMAEYVAYYRVSTKKQGRSGLGLEAQKRMVDHFIRNSDTIIKHFTETESGTNKKHRPILQKAIESCKKSGATLLIAKLDRLARSVYIISSLMESGVDFRCCDMPDANKLTLNLMASVAENEAEMVSSRTKAGLKTIKVRINENGFHVSKAGNRIKRLGNPNPGLSLQKARVNSIKTNQEKSMNNRNKNVARPYAKELRKHGMYYSDIADRLNAEGYLSSSGGKYHPMSVKRLIEEK